MKNPSRILQHSFTYGALQDGAKMAKVMQFRAERERSVSFRTVRRRNTKAANKTRTSATRVHNMMKRLATLPPAEKQKLLEKLRDQSS